jgi:hypothetical protein
LKHKYAREHTNIIVATDIYWEIGLVGQKTRRENLDVFSRLKDLVEENIMEISDIGIDQCIEDHVIYLQSRFSKYFPEAVSDKCKWNSDPFDVDSPQNYNFFSKNKKTILALYLILL